VGPMNFKSLLSLFIVLFFGFNLKLRAAQQENVYFSQVFDANLHFKEFYFYNLNAGFKRLTPLSYDLWLSFQKVTMSAPPKLQDFSQLDEELAMIREIFNSTNDSTPKISEAQIYFNEVTRALTKLQGLQQEIADETPPAQEITPPKPSLPINKVQLPNPTIDWFQIIVMSLMCVLIFTFAGLWVNLKNKEKKLLAVFEKMLASKEYSLLLRQEPIAILPYFPNGKLTTSKSEIHVDQELEEAPFTDFKKLAVFLEENDHLYRFLKFYTEGIFIILVFPKHSRF
jgi:hypothetical protein